MLGICNGFQILCEAGLLPGALRPQPRARLRLRRDAHVRVEDADPPFTSALARRTGARDPGQARRGLLRRRRATLARLEATADRAALLRRGGHVAAANPNGSLDDIAGIVQRARQRVRPDAAPRARGRAAARRRRRRACFCARSWPPARRRADGATEAMPERRPRRARARARAHRRASTKRVFEILGRDADAIAELGVFSVMWSEHCRYKSSRVQLLQTLPTTGRGVLQGPGENAGAVDIGDGLAVRVQDREPQPPVVRRAVPGRGDRRRRHPARHLHHGRAADRHPQLAALRAARRSAHALPACAASSPASALRQLHRRADGRRRGLLRPGYDQQHPGERVHARHRRAPTAIFRAKAAGVGNPGDLRRLEDRPRRHPRREPARVGGVRRAEPRRSARRCRSAIRSPRSCCSRRASS